MLPLVQADSLNQDEEFYTDCIDRRIAQCEQKIRFLSSDGSNVRRRGEIAVEQLLFLQGHKELLARKMARQGLGNCRGKIDYFLIGAYSAYQKNPAEFYSWVSQ
jgi:hypothetical protein